MSNVNCENTGPTDQGPRQRPPSKSWRAAAGPQHTKGRHPLLKAQLSQRTRRRDEPGQLDGGARFPHVPYISCMFRFYSLILKCAISNRN